LSELKRVVIELAAYLCRRWWCTWRGSRTTWFWRWNDVV